MMSLKGISFALLFLIAGTTTTFASNTNPDGKSKKQFKKTQSSEKLNGNVKSIKYLLAGFGDNPNNTTYIYNKSQELAEKHTFIGNRIATKEAYKNGYPIVTEIYHDLGHISEKTVRKFDKEGNILDIKKLDTYKNVTHHEKMKYDKLGNKVEHIVNGNPKKYTYKYDKNKNTVEIIEYDDNGLLERMDLYWYNKDNSLVKWGRYNESGINIYKVLYYYNDDMQLVNQENYTAQNQLEFKKTVLYSPDGFEKEVVEYDGSGTVQFKITYDHIDQEVAKKTEYFSDGTRTEYNYDIRNRNINKLSFYSANGELKHQEMFEYNYDDKNNWVRKTRVYNNTEEIIVRSVEYY